MALSGKQIAFVNEYLVDCNATQAAIRAGYSEKTAYAIGWENLRKPEIIEAIRAKSMGAEEVLLSLTDIARGNIADLMALTPGGFTFELMIKDQDGNLKPNPKLKLVRKIKQKVTTILGKKEDDEDREIIETELELYNAQDALVTLGKFHKLFTEQHEISGPNGGPIENAVKIYIPDNGRQ